MMPKGEKNCNCIMTVLTIGQRPKVSPENSIDPGSGNVIQCTGHVFGVRRPLLKSQLSRILVART